MLNKPKVLILSSSFGKYSDHIINKLKDKIDLEYSNPGWEPSENNLIQAFSEYDGVVLGTQKISRNVIEMSKRLKIIARHGVGIDNIDVKAATDKGIVVTYTGSVNAESVAELTLCLMLNLLRKVPRAYISLLEGKWEREMFIGRELMGKVVGLIGFGAIGRSMAKLLKGFNVTIYAYDPYVSLSDFKEYGVRRSSLEELLSKSDIVSIHAALTDETKGMIGRKEISMMKDGSYLVNTARAAIVDSKALYDALKEGKLRGAATDVYDIEPPKERIKFLDLDNFVGTPHIAAYTEESLTRMDEKNAEDLLLFFSGKRPKNIVNPEVYEKISRT